MGIDVTAMVRWIRAQQNAPAAEAAGALSLGLVVGWPVGFEERAG